MEFDYNKNTITAVGSDINTELTNSTTPDFKKLISIVESKTESSIAYINNLNKAIIGLSTRLNALESNNAILPPDADDIGIGNIIANAMTVTQFTAIHGNAYVVCDGSSCIGSRYHEITGYTSVPDLRGAFLRGYNRPVLNTDPLGRPGITYAALNSYNDDMMQNITGTIGPISNVLADSILPDLMEQGVLKRSNNGYMSLSAANTINNEASRIRLDTSYDTTLRVGTETLPKHVVVNYFIKINKHL